MATTIRTQFQRQIYAVTICENEKHGSNHKLILYNQHWLDSSKTIKHITYAKKATWLLDKNLDSL